MLISRQLSPLILAISATANTMFSFTNSTPSNNASGQIVLLGSYTNYIHSLIFEPPTGPNAQDGKLTVGPDFNVGPSFSWVTQHPVHQNLFYAVKEDEKNGSVALLKLSDNGTDLEVIKEVSSGGGAPAHCDVVADGKGLAIANYMTGSVMLLPLESDGSFTAEGTNGSLIDLPFNNGSSPLRVASRQESPHPHEVVEVKRANGTAEIWVPDLGSDTVWRLKIGHGETGSVTWTLMEGEELKGDEGGGPRHIHVSENGENLYTVNELLPALVHHQITSNASQPILKSKTSIVPPPPSTSNPLYIGARPNGAELLSLPNAIGGPILVASTRTLADRSTDVLAVFALKESGEVQLQEFLSPKNGREFRGVGASPDGKYIMAVGQSDGYVSVWGQTEQGQWHEVVQQNVTVKSATGVLFTGLSPKA